LTVQNQLIKEKIVYYQNSSSTAINETVDQFLKSAHLMAHRLVILKAENTALQQANKLATQRKQWKKKRIQHQGSLTLQGSLDLVDSLAASTQISEEMHQSSVNPDEFTKRSRRCEHCYEVGHRVETCLISC